MMLARIKVESGAKTKQLELRLPTVLGRGGASKIKLPASTVSRQHCEIYAYEEQIAIRDLGSSNGTIVNGHRIEGPTFIGPEDLVQVGPLRFKVEPISQTPSAEAAPAPIVNDAASTAEAVAPTFEELPKATETPTPAESSKIKVAEKAAADESVLQYTAPKDDGERSFVGIDVGDNEKESASEDVEPPAVEVSEDSESPVHADESALQDFFKNLGDD